MKEICVFFICKILKSLVIKTCALIRIEINTNLCMNNEHSVHEKSILNQDYFSCGVCVEYLLIPLYIIVAKVNWHISEPSYQLGLERC
jgi:hypothetical protein